MKTAIEWLVANLDIDLVDSDWYIEKAKEMEKQQMESAYLAGEAKDKQYYNETFKNTKE
jgi:hypothetical protein